MGLSASRESRGSSKIESFSNGELKEEEEDDEDEDEEEEESFNNGKLSVFEFLFW